MFVGRRLRSTRAFTLIELLIVILIVGILIAVAAPSFLGQTDKAHDSAAKQYLTIAYKAAKLSTVEEPYSGDYGDATQIAQAINDSEPGLNAYPGTCPTDTTLSQTDIVVDDGTFDHDNNSGTAEIPTTGGSNLTICNDPVHKVWTLKVRNHVLMPFESVVVELGGSIPMASAAPVVSGAPQVGQVLMTTDGTWANATSYDYQWQRCDAAGTNCADIASSASSSYIVQAADEGQTLRSKVTAHGTGGDAVATSSATTTVLPAAPVASSASSLSGDAREGETLTASPGSWSGSPSFAYSWLRCTDDVDATWVDDCTTITSADATDANATYTLVAADVGSYIRARVEGENAGGSFYQNTAATSQVESGVPVNTALPQVTGTARVGQTLTSTSGTWTSNPAPTYSYQWQRSANGTSGWTNIVAATASTYPVVSADLDLYLRSVVTATNPYASASASSAATSKVDITYPALVNSDSPLAYFRLAETSIANNSPMPDSSSHNRTAAYVVGGGTPTGGAGGALPDNAAATFGGGGYGYWNAETIITASMSWTVEAWIYPTTAGAHAGIISDNYGGYDDQVSLRLGLNLGKLDGGFYNAGGGCGWQLATDPGAQVPTNTWTHVAASWNGSVIRIYKNGVEVAAQTASAGCGPYNTGQALIGVAHGGVNAFPGRIDEAAFYGSALSQTRLQERYTRVAALYGAPQNTALPVISGPANGSMTASTGTWTTFGAPSYDYQWQRNAGAGWTNIAGATTSSYNAVPADIGSTLRVAVTATANGSTTAYSNATATVTTNYSLAVLSDNPSAYYRFEEGTTAITDVSGNGRHTSWSGSQSPGPGALTTGGTSYGASLPGGTGSGVFDAMVMDSNPAAGSYTTIELWVNGNADERMLWGYAPAGASAETWGVTAYYWNGAVGLYNQGGWGGRYTKPGTGWHHMVFEVYSGEVSTSKVYIDGVLQTAIAGSSAAGTVAVPKTFRIGGSNFIPNWTSYNFSGTIDEVAFYNRALTSAEVLAHYNAR